MARALICLAIVALQIAAGQEACCRPPDKVAHSPIPPLEQPKLRSASRVARVGFNSTSTGHTYKSDWSSNPPAAAARSLYTNQRPLSIATPQRDAAHLDTKGDSDANNRQGQSEIWNTPEMVAARDSVVEFCRLCAQTSPAEGERFLVQLSELSPEAMLNWLERFQTRRMSVSRGREVERMARQAKVEYTIRQQEARRRASANIADLRGQAADSTNEEVLLEQELEAPSYSVYRSTGSLWQTRGYDPFDAVTDPMSPRGYARRVAAAMSLPGDLPRSDPRNFIRGDEGIDLGEWATTREAVPPVE